MEAETSTLAIFVRSGLCNLDRSGVRGRGLKSCGVTKSSGICGDDTTGGILIALVARRVCGADMALVK